MQGNNQELTDSGLSKFSSQFASRRHRVTTLAMLLLIFALRVNEHALTTNVVTQYSPDVCSVEPASVFGWTNYLYRFGRVVVISFDSSLQ